MLSNTAISTFYHHHIKTISINSVSILGLSTCLILTGCSDNEQTAAVNDKAATDAIAIESKTSDNQEQAPTTETVKQEQEAVDAIVENHAVQYDVSGWSTGDIDSFGIEDLKQMQSIFGDVTMTDENSLDYASNTAIKYRFMEGDQPYLDIIDSQDYLEFGWYYANPNDSVEEKELSLSHAKKVYEAARGLMNEEGAQLIKSMLDGQITKGKEVGGQTVTLAKCEFYSCMLVLKKSDA